ncbi:hypothetical protein B1R94_14360 [Mycolicibacterium litorale]|nr:hypothetical protein B1R94_14360 [Mycolicibacterium litorale]
MISAGCVLAGDDLDPIVDGAVLIRDGVIDAVGTATGLGVPPGTARLSFPGMTILPGLVDCHDHLLGRSRFGEGLDGLTEPDGMWATVFAHYSRLTLAAGVTTVRVPGMHRGIDLVVRRAMREGFLAGPRMVCAGEAITMTGGHGLGAGIEADGPAECTRAARRQLAAGADFIKVMASGGVGTVRTGEDPTHPELTVEELAAVVGVANSARKYVAAHADGVEGIENALQAGVHCIEHGIYLTQLQAEFMANNGVKLVPTLSTMVNIAKKGAQWGLSAEWVRIADGILDVHRRSFEAALRAGVCYGTGTDGYGDMVDEITEFTTYGISAQRALRAATRDSAQIASPGAKFGALIPGWSADLLVVDGDPLTDLAALRSPVLVMLEGAVVKDTAAAHCG